MRIRLAGLTKLPRLPLRNWIITVVGACVVVAVHTSVHAGVVPHIYYEAQSVGCLPWDFYLPVKLDGRAIRRGDLVRFHARGLGPMFRDGTPMAKLAIGLPGDHISIRADRLYVDGTYWGSLMIGVRRLHKARGYWDREFDIQKGELFVLGTEPRSFDSRYWGVIHDDQIDGTLKVLL